MYRRAVPWVSGGGLAGSQAWGSSCFLAGQFGEVIGRFHDPFNLKREGIYSIR